MSPSEADTERTPLLANSSELDQPKPKPLPWRPIIVLLLLNAVQPLAYELVFPFINQMLVELRVVDDPERVGFYSGLIESIFSVTSLITILPASYAADRYGRKPVILGGIAGLGVSLIFFGMSRTFLGLVLSRCIGGGMGGVWAAVKIMLGELTDKSNQGTAFMGLMVSYRIGQTIGLPVGGFLAHPEKHWHQIFDSEFWHTYPFALPCFVGAGFAFFAVICGLLFVRETLPLNVKASKLTLHADETGNVVPEIVPGSPVGGEAESWSPNMVKKRKDSVPFASVLTKDIVTLLLSNLVMCIASEMLFTVYPLFAFTPIESGGLSFSESQIGGYLSIRSLIQIGCMFLYTPFQRSRWIGRNSPVRLYQLGMIIWPITVVCYPLLNLLAQVDGLGGTQGWVFECTMILFFVVWGFGGYCWTAMALMTTNASPSADALTAINGVLQMSVVLPQAFTPAFTTSTFALSVDNQILHGNFVWVVFFTLTAAGAIHALTLKEPVHDWREEAARVREQEAISRSSTLVAPPSPISLSDDTTLAHSNSEDRS